MIHAGEQHRSLLRATSPTVATRDYGPQDRTRHGNGAQVESTDAGAPPSRLAALLDLEVLDRDLFRAENEPGAGARMSLYGGQVAAQALRAAGATVEPDRLPHSLHGYFLR